MLGECSASVLLLRYLISLVFNILELLVFPLGDKGLYEHRSMEKWNSLNNLLQNNQPCCAAIPGKLFLVSFPGIFPSRGCKPFCTTTRDLSLVMLWKTKLSLSNWAIMSSLLWHIHTHTIILSCIVQCCRPVVFVWSALSNHYDQAAHSYVPSASDHFKFAHWACSYFKDAYRDGAEEELTTGCESKDLPTSYWVNTFVCSSCH